MDPNGLDDFLDCCRRLAAEGYAPASGGNVSCKDSAGIWVSASGADLKHLSRNELVRVDETGNHAEGSLRPTKELQLHLSIYRNRPQTRVVFHYHTPHTIAACSLLPPGSGLPAMVPTFIMRVHGVGLVPYFAPGDPELALAVGEACRRNQVVLLANHGLVSTGVGLTEAVYALEETEANARIFLLAGGVGKSLSPEACRELQQKYWRQP